MKCQICGAEFDKDDAKARFSDAFKGAYDYDLSFETSLCEQCAINEMKSRVMRKEENEDKVNPDDVIDEIKVVKILDQLYSKALNGIPKVSKSIEELASDYSEKSMSNENAAKALIKNQLIKCGTSGFITGLGGLITLPIALPANITSVLYVQIRMVAAIAVIGGFDVHSDQVQSVVYACLTGSSVVDIVKTTGIKAGQKFATAAVEKIPGKTLTAINRKVGFRFLTKFGEKGTVNIGKMIPGLGGVIGGTVDIATTKAMAKQAYKLFIEREL